MRPRLDDHLFCRPCRITRNVGKSIRASSIARVVGLCMVVALSGCRTTTERTPFGATQPEVRVGQNAAGATAARPSVALDPSLDDPCAARLHDISGQLLRYYAAYGLLPARLEDLRPFATPGQPLNLTCPVSGKPYIYSPEGLQAPPAPPNPPDHPNPLGDAASNRPRWLIVYDAEPSHKGQRWGILLEAPEAGQAPTPYVVSLPEAIFKTYKSDLPPSPQR